MPCLTRFFLIFAKPLFLFFQCLISCTENQPRAISGRCCDSLRVNSAFVSRLEISLVVSHRQLHRALVTLVSVSIPVTRRCEEKVTIATRRGRAAWTQRNRTLTILALVPLSLSRSHMQYASRRECIDQLFTVIPTSKSDNSDRNIYLKNVFIAQLKYKVVKINLKEKRKSKI